MFIECDVGAAAAALFLIIQNEIKIGTNFLARMMMSPVSSPSLGQFVICMERDSALKS